MRFLHIADLHLGKQMNDVTLLADQEFILQQIAGIAVKERADAVLIAGDVYQRSSPQAEAMASTAVSSSSRRAARVSPSRP